MKLQLRPANHMYCNVTPEMCYVCMYMYSTMSVSWASASPKKAGSARPPSPLPSSPGCCSYSGLFIDHSLIASTRQSAYMVPRSRWGAVHVNARGSPQHCTDQPVPTTARGLRDQLVGSGGFDGGIGLFIACYCILQLLPSLPRMPHVE